MPSEICMFSLLCQHYLQGIFTMAFLPSYSCTCPGFKSVSQQINIIATFHFYFFFFIFCGVLFPDSSDITVRSTVLLLQGSLEPTTSKILLWKLQVIVPENCHVFWSEWRICECCCCFCLNLKIIGLI